MDWTNHNISVDLEWYFQCASAACGVRSAFSGFESQMNARAFCAPASEGEIHVRETRQGARDNAPEERIDEYERAKAIHERLMAMSDAGRRVLELQYGSECRAGDISLSLASVQPLTIEGHRVAMEEQRDRLERQHRDAERRRLLPKIARARSRPKPKVVSGFHRTTPRDWLLFLCATDREGATLTAILEQARGALDVAMREYLRTGRLPTAEVTP